MNGLSKPILQISTKEICYFSKLGIYLNQLVFVIQLNIYHYIYICFSGWKILVDKSQIADFLFLLKSQKLWMI